MTKRKQIEFLRTMVDKHESYIFKLENYCDSSSKEITRRLEQIQREIWKLQRPPLYKKGQKVKQGLIVSIRYGENSGDLGWKYEVFTKDYSLDTVKETDIIL